MGHVPGDFAGAVILHVKRISSRNVARPTSMASITPIDFLSFTGVGNARVHAEPELSEPRSGHVRACARARTLGVSVDYAAGEPDKIEQVDEKRKTINCGVVPAINSGECRAIITRASPDRARVAATFKFK